MKKIKLIISIIVSIVFLYIIAGQFIFSENTPVNGNICDMLPGDGWVQVLDDGTKVPFSVPGKTDGDITLETVIPLEYKKDYSVLCFRGMDMEIYVGDEYRGGLHITHKLVDMMEGNITFESEYGKGSTFTVKVPQKVVVAKPVGDFSSAVKKYLNDIETEEVKLYAPEARVLVVDDNEMNLEVMEGLLRETKIKADFAESGAECIAKVSENKYDCILLDQMMPGMSGEDTLNAMKEKDILGDTPVIALTADAIIGAKENYISKGFTGYLSKPVKYEGLEKVLKTFIPAEKQLKKNCDDGLPVVILWGGDTDKLKVEKERLDGIYKCICVNDEDKASRALLKHQAVGVMNVR